MRHTRIPPDWQYGQGYYAQALQVAEAKKKAAGFLATLGKTIVMVLACLAVGVLVIAAYGATMLHNKIESGNKYEICYAQWQGLSTPTKESIISQYHLDHPEKGPRDVGLDGNVKTGQDTYTEYWYKANCTT